MCSDWRITHLPTIAFLCHNVSARRTGRGFTKYKVHHQRLYHLCCFEVNVAEVFTANEKQGECGNQNIESCEESIILLLALK